MTPTDHPTRSPQEEAPLDIDDAPVSPVVPAGETRCECGTEFEAYLCPACMAEYPAPSPVVPEGETPRSCKRCGKGGDIVFLSTSGYCSMDCERLGAPEGETRLGDDWLTDEAKARDSEPAPVSPEAPPLSAEREKLRLDAENVLTWSAPSDGADLLMFGHLRRFAKAILTLEARLTETSQQLERAFTTTAEVRDALSAEILSLRRERDEWQESNRQATEAYRLCTIDLQETRQRLAEWQKAVDDKNRYMTRMEDEHEEELNALRQRLQDADRDTERMDFLCDWVSSSELIIARGGDPTCKRVDTEGKRDRLWINPDDNGPRHFGNETLREALDYAMAESRAALSERPQGDA